MLNNRNEIFAKVSKYDRIGFTVIREAQKKTIDCLEKYDKIEEVIQQIQSKQEQETYSFVSDRENIMKRIMRRKFGGKLVRLGTPIEKTYHGSVQSPSNNKSDIMILPGVTLAESEQNRKLLNEKSNNKRDLRKKPESTGRTDGASTHAKKI